MRAFSLSTPQLDDPVRHLATLSCPVTEQEWAAAGVAAASAEDLHQLRAAATAMHGIDTGAPPELAVAVGTVTASLDRGLRSAGWQRLLSLVLSGSPPGDLGMWSALALSLAGDQAASALVQLPGADAPRSAQLAVLLSHYASWRRAMLLAAADGGIAAGSFAAISAACSGLAAAVSAPVDDSGLLARFGRCEQLHGVAARLSSLLESFPRALGLNGVWLGPPTLQLADLACVFAPGKAEQLLCLQLMQGPPTSQDSATPPLAAPLDGWLVTSRPAFTALLEQLPEQAVLCTADGQLCLAALWVLLAVEQAAALDWERLAECCTLKPGVLTASSQQLAALQAEQGKQHRYQLHLTQDAQRLKQDIADTEARQKVRAQSAQACSGRGMKAMRKRRASLSGPSTAGCASS
jgi:hypothetical protein